MPKPRNVQFVVKSVSDKSIHQKLNISKDRGLSLDDKTKDYLDRNTGGQVYSLHEVTQLGQYSR